MKRPAGSGGLKWWQRETGAAVVKDYVDGVAPGNADNPARIEGGSHITGQKIRLYPARSPNGPGSEMTSAQPGPAEATKQLPPYALGPAEHLDRPDRSLQHKSRILLDRLRFREGFCAGSFVVLLVVEDSEAGRWAVIASSGQTGGCHSAEPAQPARHEMVREFVSDPRGYGSELLYFSVPRQRYQRMPASVGRKDQAYGGHIARWRKDLSTCFELSVASDHIHVSYRTVNPRFSIKDVLIGPFDL